MASVDGDQPSTDRHSKRAEAKLMRVAKRVTNWITQGEKLSRVSPNSTLRG
jgi:hypothetical protein